MFSSKTICLGYHSPFCRVFNKSLSLAHTHFDKNIYKTANINTKLPHHISVMCSYGLMPPDNCSDINFEETKGRT